MEAVDLEAKEMGTHGFESKTEEPLGVNKRNCFGQWSTVHF